MSKITQPTLRLFVKRPTGKRRAFAVASYLFLGKRNREYIETPKALSEAVSKINTQFLAKALTELEAHQLIKDLIAKEYKRAAVPAQLIKSSIMCEANNRLFSKFWADRYESKFLEDPDSARYDFQRALMAIDPLPLLTSTQKELQNKIMKNSDGSKQARRVISRINELLEYLNRPLTLNKPKEGLVEIKYVNKAEFLEIVKKLKAPEHKALAYTLFGSGMRLSEAMALELKDVREDHVNVNKQLTVKKKKKLPKREKVGQVATFSFCREGILEWADIENKASFRYTFYNELTSISDISPHDLRHSHAIHLLTNGASLTQVALNLRNTIEVCQRYYTGFSHTDETLAALKKFV